MITVTDTSIFDKKDKRKDDYKAEIQQDVEKQEQQKQSEPVSEVKSEPTTQATPATEQKPKTRADIVQDLGINPQRDTQRMRSLQQAGKVQAYTNALSLLAQAAGGFAGATVPKIDWKNSAAEELTNLQKMYDEEDSWARRQMLLDRIQDLNRKDQQVFEEGMFDKRATHQTGLQKDQQTFQSGEYKKNRQHQFAVNKDRADQQIRQYQETRSVVDDTKNGLPGQRNKLTGEFEFDKQPITTTGGTGGTGGVNDKPFFEVYDRGSNKPVTTVQTKDQAIGLVRDIIDSNKDNPEFEEEILRIIGDKSLSDVSDEGLKFIINKYYKDYQWLDGSVNPYLQYKQQVDDYKLTNFNQEDRKNLNMFLGENRNASEEDIVDYLQKYDPNMPEGVAKGIAYQEAAKVKETEQVMQQNYMQKRDNLFGDEYRKGLMDKAHKHAVSEFGKGTKGYYKAMRTYLSKQGFSLQEANMIIEDIKNL